MDSDDLIKKGALLLENKRIRYYSETNCDKSLLLR